MRPDDDSTTAQRVSRILDQARRPETPADDAAWPQEWPPGAPDPGALGAGPRWQIPIPAAIGAAVLALLVVGLAAVLLLREPSTGTPVPPRAPGPLTGVPTGSAGASESAAAADPVAATDAAVSTSAAGQFRVYVVGQVQRAGVVSLAAGARVEDAIEAVGGATEKADLAVMNLARRVVDGERIVVPRPGEKLPTAEPVAEASAAGGGPAAGDAGGGGQAPGAPVDLNTATVAQLDALPGVGPVIAGRIVAWRQENGRFASVDDLAEVQGIGDATMAKLRPLVRV